MAELNAERDSYEFGGRDERGDVIGVGGLGVGGASTPEYEHVEATAILRRRISSCASERERSGHLCLLRITVKLVRVPDCGDGAFFAVGADARALCLLLITELHH